MHEVKTFISQKFSIIKTHAMLLQTFQYNSIYDNNESFVFQSLQIENYWRETL